MTITIRVTIDGSESESVAEVARFHRDELRAGNLGLALAEAKALLTSVQKAMVASQTSEWMIQHRRCTTCGAELRRNGQHAIVLRTVFGKLHIDSPRFYSLRVRGIVASEPFAVGRALNPGFRAKLENLVGDAKEKDSSGRPARSKYRCANQGRTAP
jgi:hypothetical protein